jgi:hypothetical protein
MTTARRPCGHREPAVKPAYDYSQCFVCWQSVYSEPHRLLWGELKNGESPPGAPAPPRDYGPRRPLPCESLGKVLERAGCGTCDRNHTYACGAGRGDSGRCVPARHCETCPGYRAEPDALAKLPLPAVLPGSALVAPLGKGGWAGGHLAHRSARVTVAIPHLDAEGVGPLAAALELWRLQSERPRLLVIDTGSPRPVLDALEGLRADDLSVSFIREHAWDHSSEPVSAAQDLSMVLVKTPYVLWTHSDVFPVRRDLVAYLLGLCDAGTPVAGYEMSPRADPRWRGTPSHTLTLGHLPTLRGGGVSWSIQRWYDTFGRPAQATVGWPDTESMFGESLRAAGLRVHLLTPENCPGARRETNFERHADGLIDHCRSYPGSRTNGSGGADYRRRAEAWMAEALAAVRDRAARWRNGEG